ncbi:DctP family TRAP transporter solute-binding subunit [Salinicoccus sp. YB14-2]|uniref:DctP family TRAP transporter solute-binding subunit n=1 Tax=Salinicoccus sp. YB14-2 TaxID=1572701 RepID=UPI0006910E2D|nr:DctP family TRAP transporter solute-binding subunit [Salinicoccus sp. YB14-2]
MRNLSLLVLITVLILSACGRPDIDEQNGQKTIRLAHLVNPTQSTHIMSEEFKKQVEEESDGRLKVELYPSGSLFPSDREAIEAVQLGNVEMTIPALASVSGFDQDFMILDLPYLFEDTEEAYSVLDGPFGQGLLDGLEDVNIKGLVYGENGFRHITNNIQPVHTPEDIEGQKMRTLESPVHADVFNAFGANASPFAFGEMYSTLQQGTYDAMESPIALMYTSNLYEVQQYMSLTSHVYMPVALLMNNDFYESLEPDLQEIVMDAAEDYRENQRVLSQEQNEEYMQEMVDAGLQVNDLTDEERQAFSEKAEPVYEKYEEMLGPELFEALDKAVEEA